jgi:hypothetical protein
MYVHWRKSTNGIEGKPEEKFDAACGSIFVTSKCFQRRKLKIYIYFSLRRAAASFKFFKRFSC